jgi:hypothetical protein
MRDPVPAIHWYSERAAIFSPSSGALWRGKSSGYVELRCGSWRERRSPHRAAWISRCLHCWKKSAYWSLSLDRPMQFGAMVLHVTGSRESRSGQPEFTGGEQRASRSGMLRLTVTKDRVRPTLNRPSEGNRAGPIVYDSYRQLGEWRPCFVLGREIATPCGVGCADDVVGNTGDVI